MDYHRFYEMLIRGDCDRALTKGEHWACHATLETLSIEGAWQRRAERLRGDKAKRVTVKGQAKMEAYAL